MRLIIGSVEKFTKDDFGAVTVDWVVLTAALVGLGIATMTVVSSGTQDVSTDISNALSQTNGKPIIRTAFSTVLATLGDGETMSGVAAYGDGYVSVGVSDALGAAVGENAYVITTGITTPSGALNGGVSATFAGSGLEAGETYRMSYWARAETGEVTVRSLGYGTIDGVNAYDGNTDRNHTVGSEWTYVEYEYTATRDGTNFYVSSDDEHTTYALDDIKVEKVDG